MRAVRGDKQAPRDLCVCCKNKRILSIGLNIKQQHPFVSERLGTCRKLSTSVMPLNYYDINHNFLQPLFSFKSLGSSLLRKRSCQPCRTSGSFSAVLAAGEGRCLELVSIISCINLKR